MLPERTHIVLTHHEIDNKEVMVFSNFEELLNYLKTLDEEVYVIGGSSIYKLFLNIANELILTEIDSEALADAYFPIFNKEEYDKELIDEHIENDISYKHVRYRRK